MELFNFIVLYELYQEIMSPVYVDYTINIEAYISLDVIRQESKY